MFAACIFEGAEDESTAAVVLDVVSQVLAGDVGRPTLVRTLDGKARAVVLVVLPRKECRVKTGRQQEGEEVTLHTCKETSPFGLTKVGSPGWYQRQTPCRSTCRAACAWGTPPCRAGTVADASSSPHTYSRSKRSLEDTHPGDSGDKIHNFKTQSNIQHVKKGRSFKRHQGVLLQFQFSRVLKVFELCTAINTML